MQLWRDPEHGERVKQEWRAAVDDLKAEVAKGKEAADANETLGARIGRIGIMLTVLLTTPIVLTTVFGLVGALVSIVIIVLYLAGRKRPRKAQQ